jgi:hypothetical protein
MYVALHYAELTEGLHSAQGHIHDDKLTLIKTVLELFFLLTTARFIAALQNIETNFSPE